MPICGFADLLNLKRQIIRALEVSTMAEQVASQLITHDGGVSLGGFLVEWADEWWKASGSPYNHDTADPWTQYGCAAALHGVACDFDVGVRLPSHCAA